MTGHRPTTTSAVSLALRRWCFPAAALTALFLLVGCSLAGSPTPTPQPVVPTAPPAVGGATPTRINPATPIETPATPANTAFGEWVAAGTLGFGRAGHTATLLADGRVLVVGGEGGSAPLASVEQYAPQANRWTAAPSLGLARSGHTATLLPSGEVLVVGGTIAPSGAIGTTPTVELFDPVAGRWRGGAPLNQPRSGQTATLLATGQVLVVGGEALDAATGQARLVPSAELYDPASNTWTLTTPPARARVGHTATLLSDGRVLIAAGETDGANGQRELGATAELFDIVGGSWTLTGDLSLARADATATLLTNGQVLVTGGRVSGGNITAAAELFDPGRGVWSVASGLGTPRAKQTATRLLDGRVLVAGGYEREAAMPTGSAERYDPASAGWVRVAPPIARTGGRAVLLRDGAVLVVGGRTTLGRYAEAVERFVPRGLVPATPSASATARPIRTATPSAMPIVTATATATVATSETPIPTAVAPPVPTATTYPPTQRPPTNPPAPPRPTVAPTQEPAEPTASVPPTELPAPTAIPPTVVAPTVAPPTVTVVAPTATPTVRITPSPTAAPPIPTGAATAAPTAAATVAPTATTAATSAPARTGTIFGTIQFCTGQQCAPAVGAVVSTDSGATRTDDGGVYALSGVPASTVRVNVTYSPASGGTYTATQTVNVPAGGRVPLNFTLQPSAQGVDDPSAAPVAPAAVDGNAGTVGHRPLP